MAEVKKIVPVKTYIEPFLNKKIIYKENLKKSQGCQGYPWASLRFLLRQNEIFFLADLGSQTFKTSRNQC